MRIFAAIDVSPEARAGIVASVARLRAQPGLEGAVRWTRPEQLHLTLVFLGDVTEARVDALVRAWHAPWRSRPFTLRLGTGGVFPERGRPKVLWLGPDAGVVETQALREECTARMAACACQAPEGPFHPHVTLGRVRRGWPVGRAELGRALFSLPHEVPAWTVDRLPVYQSHLNSSGSVYRRIAQGRLGTL